MQRGIILLGLMVFAMGQTILFALLGPAARDIGLAEWQVGAIISASAVVFVLVSPFWGSLADRWGRKNVIVAGLGSYAFATVLFAWLLGLGLEGAMGTTIAFASLVAARLLYALGSGGIQPAAVAMMADLTSKSDRSAGVAAVGAAFGIGTVVGPGVAYLFVGFGLLVPLFVAAGAALVLALLAGFFVHDPERLEIEEDGQDEEAETASIASLAPFLALGLITFIAISAIQQTTSFFLQDFTGADATETTRLAGNAFVVLALAMLFVQGFVVQKLKPAPTRMLAIGFPVAALGIAVMALAPSYVVIVAGVGVMGAGFGLVQPGISAIVSLATGADSQGNAAGYVQAAMAGGFVIGPLAGTTIYALSPTAPLFLALGCCVVCFALFVWTARFRLAQSPEAA
ncbi:MAG: MFS transporter [Pseudomonadota bacterium]